MVKNTNIHSAAHNVRPERALLRKQPGPTVFLVVSTDPELTSDYGLKKTLPRQHGTPYSVSDRGPVEHRILRIVKILDAVYIWCEVVSPRLISSCKALRGYWQSTVIYWIAT